MRPLAVLGLVLSLPVLAGAGPVDLNRPGVLERIGRDDPERYAALREILDAAAQFPCQPAALRSLAARHGLREAECGALLLTRYPAQRVLTFVFRGTPYAARVAVPATERVAPALAHR